MGLGTKDEFLAYVFVGISTLTVFFVEWPNLLYWIAFHVRLAECHFLLQYFGSNYINPIIHNQKQNDHNSDSVCVQAENIDYDFILSKNDLIKTYLRIYETNKEKSNSFLWFILILITVTVFSGWYAITYWIASVTNVWVLTNEKGLIYYWAVFFTVMAIYQAFYTFGGIWSGVLWTEYFEQNIKTVVNEIVNTMLEHRTSFHQTFVNLKEMNDKKGDLNGTGRVNWKSSTASEISLRKQTSFDEYCTDFDRMMQYSKQEACLEILNQLLRVLNEKPCVYQVLGVVVSRESVKVFVGGFVVGKILSLMWNTVDLD